jgi:putative ABC transport system ATP-binding protein
MIQTETFVQLKNVTKTFNGNSQSFAALKNINLSFNKNEFIVIIGKSGSGKSTLLNMISGIDNPSCGEIYIDKMPLHNMSGNQLASWRGRFAGIVFQFFQLMPTLTVLENIMLPMEFVNVIPKSQRQKRAFELLEITGMKDHANKFPNALSGGEKQRVAIARSLANNPEIIFADEPTGNLDSHNADIIHKLFNTLNQQGKTIVYVTHDRDIALNYSRLIRLNDGQIIENTLINTI